MVWCGPIWSYVYHADIYSVYAYKMHILKLWCNIKNPTPLIDAYLLEFHPNPIWNDGVLDFLREKKEKEQQEQ